MLCVLAYLWCLGRDLSSLRELALTKQHVELAYKQLLSSCQVVASGHAKGKVRITKGVGDIGNQVAFIYTNGENLREEGEREGGGERRGRGK